jgi:CheY-like chemotaxis protein
LVAEDNAVNQTLLSRMLERRGCAVDVAANGMDAVSLALKTPYDLVLMDCQMPEMDGYEATRRILKALGDRAPAVIAVTARALDQDRQDCLDVGMRECLVKPISGAAIDNILENWLRAVDQAQEPAVTATVVTAT